MEKISKHVYWLPPAPPDRPSLCAVEGERATIWLDAGSSPAHTREFLDALASEGVAKPTHVVLTHSHWDHVFGADELGAHVVAHELHRRLPPRARGNRLERRGARPPGRGRRELPAARRQRQTGAAVAPRRSHQARRDRVPRGPRLRAGRRSGAGSPCRRRPRGRLLRRLHRAGRRPFPGRLSLRGALWWLHRRARNAAARSGALVRSGRTSSRATAKPCSRGPSSKM